MYRILLVFALIFGAGAVSAQQPDIKLPKLKGKKLKEPKIKEKVKGANKKLMNASGEGNPASPAGLTVTEEGVEENKEKKKKREEQ